MILVFETDKTTDDKMHSRIQKPGEERSKQQPSIRFSNTVSSRSDIGRAHASPAAIFENSSDSFGEHAAGQIGGPLSVVCTTSLSTNLSLLHRPERPETGENFTVKSWKILLCTVQIHVETKPHTHYPWPEERSDTPGEVEEEVSILEARRRWQ